MWSKFKAWIPILDSVEVDVTIRRRIQRGDQLGSHIEMRSDARNSPAPKFKAFSGM